MDQESDINPDESISQQLADDAIPLCPNCLSECDPLDNYCLNCDSNEAINPLASYIPFVKIRFETGMFGKLWRKCWHSQTPSFTRGLCICIAFLFYSPIFLIGLPFLFVKKIKDDNTKRLYSRFCYIFAIALILAFFSFRFILAFRMI